MNRFKVGDIVEYWFNGKYCYRAKVITDLIFNVEILDYPGVMLSVGNRYYIDLGDVGFRLAAPPLTKEQKFAISKNRVEGRHLRKKVSK